MEAGFTELVRAIMKEIASRGEFVFCPELLGDIVDEVLNEEIVFSTCVTKLVLGKYDFSKKVGEVLYELYMEAREKRPVVGLLAASERGLIVALVERCCRCGRKVYVSIGSALLIELYRRAGAEVRIFCPGCGAQELEKCQKASESSQESESSVSSPLLAVTLDVIILQKLVERGCIAAKPVLDELYNVLLHVAHMFLEAEIEHMRELHVYRSWVLGEARSISA